MPIVDTSFLVALFNVDDRHHARAVQDAQASDELLVPVPVLVELVQTVFYGTLKVEGAGQARRRARRARRDLLDIRLVRLEFEYDEALAGALFEARPALSYVDAVGIALASKSDKGLLTYDRDQETALKSHRTGRP